MTFNPFPYQVTAAEQAAAWGGRALFALEMGLGKSACSLLTAKNYLHSWPAVVLCPASLKFNWEREASKHFNLRAEILDGTKPPDGKLPGSHKLTIINYDILPWWLEYLARLDPQLIIVDESQVLGNKLSRRSKLTKILCAPVPHILALSGTPITSRPIEFYPILNILYPKVFSSYWKFAQRFCAPKRTPWGWDVRGASNLDELHELLTKGNGTTFTGCMIRMRKVDVIKDLPEKRRIVLPLEIDNRKDYEKASKDFIKWLYARAPGKASRAIKAERLVQMGYLKRLAGRLKLNNVYEWIDKFLQDTKGKLLLFGVHKAIIKRLKKRYANICVVVDGSVTKRKRQLAVDKFQLQKHIRIFIGNVKAAGVGLTLTKAYTIAFFELSWTPGEHIQAEDRAYARVNDMHGATVYYLVARDTIESMLLKVIEKKQGVLNAVMDGGRRLGDNLDVYAMLEKEMLKTAKPTSKVSSK